VKRIRAVRAGRLTIVVTCLPLWTLAGCATSLPATSEWCVREAVEVYAATQAERLTSADSYGFAAAPGARATCRRECGAEQRARVGGTGKHEGHDRFDGTILTLGTFEADAPPTSGPTTARVDDSAPTSPPVAPDGYWRKDLWHQMGHEAVQLGTRDFWRGYKSTFWNLPNVLVLSATMGASITIRETGVDDTIRNRTHGSRALGDMDETIQILGHPGTHFAAAGVLWVGSTLTQDMKTHEVAKALTQALAVNGATTLVLKAATNTRAPDGERYAWPSGHTSSAFAAAAVLNEYYGPWVGVPSLALAGLVGFQRLDSRVHDFSDVVFGAMLGYVIGTSIARDDKAQFPELFGMQVVPYVDPETSTTGLALMRQW